MKVVVMGPVGFIGSNLVYGPRRRGFEVNIFEDFNTDVVFHKAM